jgi:CspA family cold shock protein
MNEPVSAAESASVLSDVEGTVKWFDARKGYGFVVGPQGQDIFVHFSVIEQSQGFRTLRDGERVRYSASSGQKGWSAMKVTSLGRVADAPAQA